MDQWAAVGLEKAYVKLKEGTRVPEYAETV